MFPDGYLDRLDLFVRFGDLGAFVALMVFVHSWLGVDGRIVRSSRLVIIDVDELISLRHFDMFCRLLT
jgi:hypothetical protein